MNKRLLLVALLLLGSCAQAQVSYQRLLGAEHESQNWLTYSGRYAGWRYSELDQINTGNAPRLAMQWTFQVADLGQFETTPLVVDGVLYGTGQNDRAFALDGRTGRPIWRYQRNLPDKLQPCCGAVNRGFAILGHKLFMATLDGHVIALDTKTGNLVWDVKAADSTAAYVFTVAPLVVKNEVIVGVSGGEYGVRGFVDAYDADTGSRRWRFETVPGPGEPGHETWTGDSWKTGGAPAWITGSFDPELNLVYWPTGNPSPSDFGGERGGDNLYSNSMLALDADTGKLKWYFQFTPHDLYDYDATQVPVLLDADWEGQPRKLLVQANRNGFLYVLDRTNGQFLLAKPFVKKMTWASGFHPDGSPILIPGQTPTISGTKTCPGVRGATNWYSTAFDPDTKLFYLMAAEDCGIYRKTGRIWDRNPDPSDAGTRYVRALNIETGDIVWEKLLTGPQETNYTGVLATAGGLVFHGETGGDFAAVDSKSGKTLWTFRSNDSWRASPMTYMVDGRQYIAGADGSSIISFALGYK